MKNENKLALTWISYLSYALTGALVIVTGVVMGDIAAYFHVPITSMGNTFTFLNAGILLAIFLNAWLMEMISLKKQLVFGFILMLVAISGLVWGKSLIIFSCCVFILGLVSGITMSIGTFLITHLYEGRQRGARLLFTDSFFSMAGTLFPIIAATLLARHFAWYIVYCCIGVIYLAIFFLTLKTKFPVLIRTQATDSELVKEKWNPCVYVLALAALCYILGQLGLMAWVPNYASTTLHYKIDEAGQLVSHFWTAYMIGMWVFSLFLRYIDLQKVLIALSGISTALIYCFTHTQHPKTLALIIMALGFFSSAIYTTIITLGSQQTRIASPKLVNFILTFGTIGTMLTFIVTSPLVEIGGPILAINTANALYFAVFILCIVAGFFSKHRVNSSANQF